MILLIFYYNFDNFEKRIIYNTSPYLLYGGEIIVKKLQIIVLFIFLIISSVIPLDVFAIEIDSISVIQDLKEKNQNYIADFDIIIITPSSFKSYLEPLIEHKNNIGLKTNLIEIKDIYDGKYFNVQGRDNQEKIKYFIKDAIENWGISYVLFVGNYEDIPVRFCYNNDNYSNYPELKFVSELYFADIYDSEGYFSSWDSDNDGIFGKWAGITAEDKPIDLIPDICLGRLPCNNKNEVEIVVNKIINYEENPADPSWFKRFVVAGGDTYLEFQGNEGEIYNQKAIDVMDGFTAIKLWASNNKLSKQGFSLISNINKGCGFLYLSGHGNTNVWVTNTPDQSQAGYFGLLQQLFLFNSNKLPVCLVGGCHNSEFNLEVTPIVKNNFYFLTWIKNCWSWRMVSKKNGGTIATIGTTGLCWYSAEYDGGGTDFLNIQFFKEYKNDTVIIGQIWKNAITKFLEVYPINWKTPAGGNHSLDAKTVQEWTLIGDPSLIIGGSKIRSTFENIFYNHL